MNGITFSSKWHQQREEKKILMTEMLKYLNIYRYRWIDSWKQVYLVTKRKLNRKTPVVSIRKPDKSVLDLAENRQFLASMCKKRVFSCKIKQRIIYKIINYIKYTSLILNNNFYFYFQLHYSAGYRLVLFLLSFISSSFDKSMLRIFDSILAAPIRKNC